MFANAKTFNALPQHEKSREKNHKGIKEKGEEFRGRGEGTFKKVPFPPPRFSLRYAPRAASSRLRARAS